MAEFAMVTSLQDGMNLVAKEFIASQVEQRGVFLCSEFAGAADALDDAVLINPYDTERVADTLKHAIEMSCEEKAHRMARLQTHVAEHNIFKWLADIFTTLEHIQGANDVAALAGVEAPADSAVALYDAMSSVRCASMRMATQTPIVAGPAAARLRLATRQV